MEIRKPQKEDVPQIEAIFDQHWSDDFRDNLSQKLDLFLNTDSGLVEQNFSFIVAAEDSGIHGVAAIRDCPPHMMEYTTTERPGEFYVGAVKEKGRGVGRILKEAREVMAKERKYTEVVLFGGEEHKESWTFFDDMGFERVSEMTAPNGEKGYVWAMKI